ncbi:MAG: V-type ATPase subunit [Firmicutes bacterium]|nr:V-type ATPase subunit [Bacillota bacterium]
MNDNATQTEQKSFCYANGLVSALSLALLTSDKLLQLAQSPSLADALKFLRETKFGAGKSVENPEDFEQLLQTEWESVTEFISAQSAQKAATDCFLLAHDIHNLKVLTKQKYLRLTESGVPLLRGVYPVQSLTTSVLQDDYSALPKEIAQGLEDIDKQFYLGNRKPSVIDALLQKAYYKTVTRLLKSCKSPQLKAYFTIEIDCKNILSLLRIKKHGLTKDALSLMFIADGALPRKLFDALYAAPADGISALFDAEEAYQPYRDFIKTALAEYKNNLPFTQTELLYVDMQNKIIVPHKSDVDGILPLIQYYLAKKTEIDNLRLIVVCIKNRIAQNEIIKRLRKVYV